MAVFFEKQAWIQRGLVDKSLINNQIGH